MSLDLYCQNKIVELANGWANFYKFHVVGKQPWSNGSDLLDGKVFGKQTKIAKHGITSFHRGDAHKNYIT